MATIIMPGDLEAYMNEVNREMTDFDREMNDFNSWWNGVAVDLFGSGKSDEAKDLTIESMALERDWAKLYRGIPVGPGWLDFYKENIGAVFTLGTKFNETESYELELVNQYDALARVYSELSMQRPTEGFAPVVHSEKSDWQLDDTLKAVGFVGIGVGVLLLGWAAKNVSR